jgi:hypothetical protein
MEAGLTAIEQPAEWRRHATEDFESILDALCDSIVAPIVAHLVDARVERLGVQRPVGVKEEELRRSEERGG